MDVPFKPSGSLMSSITFRSCHLFWAIPPCPVALCDECAHDLPAGKDFPFAQERFLLLSDSVTATIQVSNLRSVEIRSALEASVSGVSLCLRPPLLL